MKKYFLLCCLALVSACTNNSGSNSQTAAPPSADAKAAAEPTVSTTPGEDQASTASDFEITGTLAANYSKLNRDSAQYASEHGLFLNDLVIADGKVLTIADLQAMRDSAVDFLIANSCVIKLHVDGDDRFLDSTLELNSPYHFVTKVWNVDLPSSNSKDKVYSGEGTYSASEGSKDFIDCYFKMKNANSLDAIATDGSTESVLRRNFRDLATITTIK